MQKQAKCGDVALQARVDKADTQGFVWKLLSQGGIEQLGNSGRSEAELARAVAQKLGVSNGLAKREIKGWSPMAISLARWWRGRNTRVAVVLTPFPVFPAIAVLRWLLLTDRESSIRTAQSGIANRIDDDQMESCLGCGDMFRCQLVIQRQGTARWPGRFYGVWRPWWVGLHFVELELALPEQPDAALTASAS